MQSQIKTTTNVHIKVAHNGEFRRFLLTEPTFINLETTIKTLFSIASPVVLKFQDDEKDWVLLTNDTELLYAIDLSGSAPLRVDVTQISAVTSTPTSQETAEPQPNADCGEGCWKGRGRGCGRGRGGRGRGGKNFAERLEAKQVSLAGKIADLEETLNSTELTTEREQTVRCRLSRLQEKLEFITAKRASLLIAMSQNPTEETEETKEEPSQGNQGKGRRGGSGRGCPRKLLPPELLEDFHQKKDALRVAKEGGNKEEIEACKEAFWPVKEAKFAVLAALRAERANENATA